MKCWKIQIFKDCASGGEPGRGRAPDVSVPPARGQEALCGHPQGKECPQNGHHGIFRYFNA